MKALGIPGHGFYYAGTLSLSKELQKLDVSDIGIGDVLATESSPGIVQ